VNVGDYVDPRDWYRIVLTNDDGRVIAEAVSPVLPRFIHVHDTGDDHRWEASDEADPSPGAGHVETFARIGSAVWIKGTYKDALFLRVV